MAEYHGYDVSKHAFLFNKLMIVNKYVLNLRIKKKKTKKNWKETSVVGALKLWAWYGTYLMAILLCFRNAKKKMKQT